MVELEIKEEKSQIFQNAPNIRMFLISVPPTVWVKSWSFSLFHLELSSAETFIGKTGLCFSRWLGNQQEGVKCSSYAIWSAEGLKLQCLSVQGSNYQALRDKRDEKKESKCP